MTSQELIGGLTFMVLFALIILFLSWDSGNDNGFVSKLFSLDDDSKNNVAILATFVAIGLITFFIF
jgi:hypothetical protein